MSRLTELTHYSQKVYDYLTKKFKAVSDSISSLSSKVDSDKQEMIDNIKTTNDSLTSNIKVVDGKVTDTNDRIDNLKTDVDNINLTPVDGDVLNISNVQQYELKNVAAGDIIKIDNNNSDIIVDCYTEFTSKSSIDYKIINLNSSTTSQFQFDPRFIETTPTGVRPRQNITLNYAKTTETIGGLTFDVYTSDVLPIELAASIESITSIGEN